MRLALAVATTDWLAKHPALRNSLARMVARIPLSLRLGKAFWAWYSFFRESEGWSTGQLQSFQFDRIRQLLAHLVRTSSFYRERLDGVEIESIRCLDDFRRALPALTRNEFASNYDRILSTDYRTAKLSKAQSSGTTGKALQFYHTAEDNMREWAAICHQWSRVGYDPVRSRRAEFRGLTQHGSIVESYPEKNMVRCSVLHLKPDHISHYADAIRNCGADFFHGYPSALHILASTISRERSAFPQPRAVLLASEEVHSYQLAAIEKAFPQAKVFAHYGCAERTVLAGWCEYRREYHVLPQYSIVELDSQTREIIGTNLFNFVNGFVRYRMTDTVLESDARSCPDCGRPYVPRLVSLGGRCEDYLYSPQHGWIPPAIITYPLKGLRAVQEIQIRQRAPDAITVRYTTVTSPNDDRLERELSLVKAGLQRLFGDGFGINFERTDDFPRTPSGKFKWIVNEMAGLSAEKDVEIETHSEWSR